MTKISLGQFEESFELTELDHESQRNQSRWHLGFEGQSNKLRDSLLRQLQSCLQSGRLTRSVLTHPVFDRVRP